MSKLDSQAGTPALRPTLSSLGGAHLESTTTPIHDSLSPRRRSGERGFQKTASIRWKLPPLPPLVLRGERAHEASAMVVLLRCAPLGDGSVCALPISGR